MRTPAARLTWDQSASTINCWSNSICRISRRLVRLQRFLPHRGPERASPFALVAFELVSTPEQRAENHGAVVAGQVHDASFDDEATEFDKMPRALAAIDLPRPHVIPRPCGLMPVARRSVAQERRPCRGQLSEHFAAAVPERTRPRA